MKNLFEIKICGIKDEDSMSAALNCKIDYIGLVFYQKSPRNVSISLAKSLVKLKNNITKIVALTVNADNDLLLNIKQNIFPDYFQLHGDETPKRCEEIRSKFKIPIIKGIGVKDKKSLNNATKLYDNVCDIIILDAPSTMLPGGNGKKFDWGILKDYNPKVKWMLAGGLNIHNIYEAINLINPPAIDVSSGVEKSKGIKDPKLILNFVEKCKNYNG